MRTSAPLVAAVALERAAGAPCGSCRLPHARQPTDLDDGSRCLCCPLCKALLDSRLAELLAEVESVGIDVDLFATDLDEADANLGRDFRLTGVATIEMLDAVIAYRSAELPT
jgi:hypothetical protein